MSLLPLPGLTQALAYFTLYGVPVRDVQYVHFIGEDKEIDLEDRTISAAIDPSNMKQLEILFGPGNVSAGDILIYTKYVLFIIDIFGPDDVRRQSYLTYSGSSYRIMHYQDWMQQAGVNVYLGRQHIEQQG